MAKYLYEKYNDTTPPVNEKDLVLGIPSATELCRALVEEMKQNQSENLIIDLRRNQGGNAFISSIFLYYFYGKETLISFSNKNWQQGTLLETDVGFHNKKCFHLSCTARSPSQIPRAIQI